MFEDGDRSEQATRSRDPRFDGCFYVAATTTGTYCRPSCPTPRPRRERLRFLPTAAAAQVAGFRPCLRCPPAVTPGSPEWNVRADTVARAMRLIRDGVVDREGAEGLARRLSHRLAELDCRLMADVGAGVASLARAQRAETARLLLESTDLPVARVAEAAGFVGRGQCTDTIRNVFAITPTGLRRHATGPGRGEADRVVLSAGASGSRGGWTLRLRLPARRPFDGPAVLAFLAGRAVPGIEATVGTVYERTLRLPRGHAVVRFAPSGPGRPGRLDRGPASVDVELWLSDLSDLTPALSRCRQFLDLDADPEGVGAALGADPWLGRLVSADPGRRVPGATDGFELAVRGVVGQQVSLAGARTVAGRLVAAAGERVEVTGASDPSSGGAGAGATHLFPTPEALVALARDEPGAFSMPASRRRAIVALATAVADGSVVIDPGTDPAELRAVLTALPGIGPWTAEYVALRGLRDPDAFLPTDIGVRRAARRLGLPDDRRTLAAVAETWRPWRSYAMVHLWAVAGQPASPGGTS